MDIKNEVIDTYHKSSISFPGNSNSLHELGLNSRKLENAASKQILNCLNLFDKEIIYTSGNTESYNLILINVKDDLEIVTDIKDFYDIGVLYGKNIKYGNIKDIITDNTYMISSSSDEFFGDKYVYHLDISYKYDLSDINKFDYITIEDDIPFFGCVIKKKNKELIPLIVGGKSVSKYRSGTAPTNLIASFSKLIKLKYKK